MAVSIENFRSSIHGFNRMDVVQFIQELTIAHEKEVRALQETSNRLQEDLETVCMGAEELRIQNDTLVNEAEELRIQNNTLTNEIERLKTEKLLLSVQERSSAVAAKEQQTGALDEPISPARGFTSGERLNFDEKELAAYRRAELTERMARDRANASAERMKSLFSQVDEKLRFSCQDIEMVTEAFRSDFEQLQQVLNLVQEIFDDSAETLKTAADICQEV